MGLGNIEIADYVSNTLSGAQSTGTEKWISIVALGLLGLFALTLLWRMFRGFLRGARLQLLSTCTIVVSVVASIFVTKLAATLALDSITVENVEKILSMTIGSNETTNTVISVLKDLPTETVRYVVSIPLAVFMAPFLFVAVYGVIRFILFIVQRIIKSVLKIKGPQSFMERVAGLCLATVEATVVFAIIILPISSMLSFADEVMGSVVAVSDNGASAQEANAEMENTASAGDNDLLHIYSTYVQPTIVESPVLWVANNAVNDAVVKSISSISPDGNSDNLREEFIDIVDLILVEVSEVKSVDFKNPTEEDKETITHLIDRLADNGIVSAVLSGTVSATAQIMDSDTLGIKVDPPLDAVVNDVLDIMKTCTADTLKDDLYLIRNIYFLLADENILASIGDEDALLKALTTKDEGEEDNAVQKLVALINENERTKPLITTLTKLSITMLASQLGNSDFVAEETYDNLKTSMNEVLAVEKDDYDSHEEYMDALTDTLDTNLKANGIEIEKDIVTNIAEYIDETYPDSTELSDEEFNDVLLSYFDAYLEYQENGTVPDDMLPPGFNPDDIPGYNPGEPNGGTDSDDSNDKGISNDFQSSDKKN